VTSKNCPWKVLSKTEVSKKYENRMKQMKEKEETVTEVDPTVVSSIKPTETIVQSTGTYLAGMRT
jgi:hypothetical protein